MQEYKQYIITKGGRDFGLYILDIKEYLITPHQYKKFEDFMDGRIMGMVDDIPQVVFIDDYLAFINEKSFLKHSLVVISIGYIILHWFGGILLGLFIYSIYQ